MDIVFLNNIKTKTIIGLHPWERQVKQPIYLDLELGTDIRASASSDDINHTLDYETIARHVTNFTENQSFMLIETLAEQLATELLAKFKLPWLRLKVSKPCVTINAYPVGVIIERGKKPCS